MKLNISAFASAMGFALAAGFTVCAFFVAVAPEATAAVIGYLLHINLSGLTRPLTFPSYIAGVLAVGLYAALWSALAAKIYNLIVGES